MFIYNSTQSFNARRTARLQMAARVRDELIRRGHQTMLIDAIIATLRAASPFAPLPARQLINLQCLEPMHEQLFPPAVPRPPALYVLETAVADALNGGYGGYDIDYFLKGARDYARAHLRSSPNPDQARLNVWNAVNRAMRRARATFTEDDVDALCDRYLLCDCEDMASRLDAAVAMLARNEACPLPGEYPRPAADLRECAPVSEPGSGYPGMSL